jgi:hypothetical protein
MTDPTLWDVFAAEAARDEALARVEANADPEWKARTLDAIRWLCRTQREITTDDVWLYLRQHDIAAPHEPRALGAVMNQARNRGWIAATDRVINSSRPECHRRPVRVWQVI